MVGWGILPERVLAKYSLALQVLARISAVPDAPEAKKYIQVCQMSLFSCRLMYCPAGRQRIYIH